MSPRSSPYRVWFAAAAGTALAAAAFVSHRLEPAAAALVAAMGMILGLLWDRSRLLWGRDASAGPVPLPIKAPMPGLMVKAAPALPGTAPGRLEDEARARVSEGRLQAVLDVARSGIWQLDEAGRTLFGNPHLASLFGGLVPDSLVASGLTLAGPADPYGPFGFPAGQEAEALLRRPGQPPLRLIAAASPWLDQPGGGRGFVLSLLDVTPLKAAQARIEHLAEHDPLTGLANRAAFHAGLQAMAMDPHGGALFVIDLDHMKAANDRFGHAAGDALLRGAAQRLRDAMRPSDMVCRLGGDEFAILAFGTDADQAEPIARRLRSALRDPIMAEGVELPVSASIGIACSPSHASDADALARAADLALYEAKSAGRGAASLFRPALRERHEQRAAIREALTETLRRDMGELILHLQPQQNLDGRILVGAEALVRWHSQRFGRWVYPGEILPAAGDAGLLQELDRFVLREATRMIARWNGRPDAPPRLGINISSVTLHNPGFAAEVAAALSRNGVAPELLEIEIPEDLAVADLPSVAHTLSALQDIGVALALDDFGSGHSAMPHVVRLPVHRLKLDRSIVSGLPEDPKSYALLRATMALARSMGIEVVGEGVETEAQAFALRRAGCNVVQGWLVGKPMPEAELLPPPGAAPRFRVTG
jgi:diguanylate cyclase (GGDEF)-like protein